MDELLRRDLAVNWHPLVSFPRQLAGEVVEVKSASGDHLLLADGRRIIDGISSWWCKLLGYQHPRLREALIRQAGKLEHSIFANTTSAPLVELSEMLCQRIKGVDRVIYAGDGSSVVDMAAKLSLFVHRRHGAAERCRFARLQNAYHGESIGAMSVSDVDKYISDFAGLCFKSHCLTGVPYVNGREHPLWTDAQASFDNCRGQLEAIAPSLAAIIVEPLLQGAGGMKVYSADFLARLCQWAQANGVHIIADEIMTGMGRCGSWTALSQAGCTADIVLLSKSLTAGWMPFSALLCSKGIADAALVKAEEPFPHSHTYMGHPLGAALACAAIEVIESEGVLDRAKELEGRMRKCFERIQGQTKALENIRAFGAVVAAEIVEGASAGELAKLSGRLLDRGLLLRPLGRTFYWMPPATVGEQTLAQMEEISAEALSELMHSA